MAQLSQLLVSYYRYSKINSLLHGTPLLYGGGAKSDHPWFFDPKLQIFAKFNVKLFIGPTPLIRAHPRSFRTVFKVTTAVPKRLIDFFLKCRHEHKNGPIELKFEKYTRNSLLFDICSVFWKIAKNGDFRFWGSSLTDPKNDPNDPLFFSGFLSGNARMLKNI